MAAEYPVPPLLYTAEEAGNVLSLSRATVFKLIANGDLESVTIGRSRRVTRTGIERFIERLRDQAGSESSPRG